MTDGFWNSKRKGGSLYWNYEGKGGGGSLSWNSEGVGENLHLEF